MRGKTIKMIDESNITLQQAFEEFLDLKRSLKKSPATIEYYENVFKTFR